MRHLPSFLIFTLSFFVFSGCSHFKDKHRRPSPEKVWQQVRQSYDGPRPPYLAEGNLSLHSPEFDQSFSFILRWESASRLRVDVSGFLGFTLASAAVCDSLAWLNIPLKSLYLKGQLRKIDSASARTLGFPLDQFLRMLEGRPPLPAGSCDFTGEDKLLSYECRDSLAAYLFRVDPARGRIVEYSVRSGDGDLQQIVYGNWRNLAQDPRPYSIEMKKPGQDVEISVSYQKISPVDSFASGTWQQPLPRGVNPGEF